ncbi:multidrug resistance-associated protein 1-like [Uloborus diversus]|uniref:multidrug resistance-associated protein 1-like n=1 Tax=Uloborus diversus TaxID=327109 RepID=UPI00240977EA|nr:multidrug resistance-associated protein 1-like [Uloborus diversus]
MVAGFCRDELWNLNETWYTDIPDFTTCFQDTVLILVPSVIFSITGLINICRLSKFPARPLPWTWLNISKLLIVTLMILKHKKCGVTTSTILSIFWILFAAFSIILHRSSIIRYFYLDVRSQSLPVFILNMMYHSFIYIELVLSAFVDKRDLGFLENRSPIEEASILSFISYSWFNKVIYNSRRKLLTVKDLFPLPVRLKSSYLYKRLSMFWDVLDTNSSCNPNIAWILVKTFWYWMLVALALDVLFNVGQLLPPLVLDRIIDFVHSEEYEWRGYLYCFAIFFTTVTHTMLRNNCVFFSLCIGAQVKSALINAVFRKNLWISSETRKNYSSGNLLNLISVDVERITSFSEYASALISAPLKIILIMFLMWQYLGPSCLAGLSVIFILVPVSFYFSRLSENFTDKQMEIKDLRLKFMNEILSGIKLIKFYVWELPFLKKVSDTRKNEMKYIRFGQLCFVVSAFVFSIAPYLVALASFTTYLFVSTENILSPTKAFVTLTLMDQLRYVLFDIPATISELIQTITSLKRLKEFFLSEQLNPDSIGTNPGEGNAISFKDCSLTWSKDTEPFLRNINLNIGKGKLIAVIGPVGAGKSSLLSALLGEMNKINGTIDIKGSMAYVPQQAWILNQTVKNNVLFVKPMKEVVYNKVLDQCCLRPDMEILPAGDQTEIGEKGINLSGGQKQRISLARAVFQDEELYLLDDPLSAVDVHVRKALFDNVIGNNGLLKRKTRILVTHDITVLPSVDLIVSMKEGHIVEMGTYDELMSKENYFAAFIKEHANLSTVDEGVKKYERSLSRLISTDSTASEVSMESMRSGDKNAKLLDIVPDIGRLVEDETMEVGGVKQGIYLNYIKHVGWLYFILATLGYIGFVTIQAGGTIWVAKWTSDPIINGTEQKSQTIWRISVYGAILMCEAISTCMGVTVLVYGSTKASELYHKEMLSCVLKCPMSFFDSTPMGRVMNRFTTDMDVLDTQIVYAIDSWFSCIFYVLASFIVIGINTPIFLASILPFGLLYYIIQTLHLTASRQIKRLASTTRSPVYSQFIESVHGVSSIKAYNVQKDFIGKFENILDTHITCVISNVSCNRWLHFWLDAFGTTIVLIATSLAIVKRHSLGPSIVALIVSYALSVMDALMWLVRSNTELETRAVSAERAVEYTQLKSEAAWTIPDKDPSSDWPHEGTMMFDDYSTRYREDLDLALREITFDVSSNEKVGVIGRTGAGKSSVTLALFRIIEPASGTIFIDNVDIASIGLHALRSKLTIIPQDPVLFTGTLRFNLDPNDEYTDEELWFSLERSHLKNFVSDLVEGLNHNIEEGGGNLSAGQRQLLCLARALLKKTKILVLDEATAAVDINTDQLIQNTIRTAFSDRTVITIAHRLNTVIDYDKIVVMDSGQVLEIGKPSELLQNTESNFYKMVKEAGLI